MGFCQHDVISFFPKIILLKFPGLLSILTRKLMAVPVNVRLLQEACHPKHLEWDPKMLPQVKAQFPVPLRERERLQSCGRVGRPCGGYSSRRNVSTFTCMLGSPHARGQKVRSLIIDPPPPQFSAETPACMKWNRPSCQSVLGNQIVNLTC